MEVDRNDDDGRKKEGANIGLTNSNVNSNSKSNNNNSVWHEEVKDDSKPPLKDVQIYMKAETVVLQSPEIFH